MEQTACQSCGAVIFWLIMAESQKRMPVDVQPVADGNVVIVGEQGYVLKKGQAFDGERFASHFATCPNARQHRKARIQ